MEPATSLFFLPTCSWYPVTAGVYLLSATARDAAGGVEENATLWYTITAPSLTAVSLYTAPDPPQTTGTPITLTALAVGGTNVQYQFWVYEPAASPAWSCLQAYSSLNT